MDNFKIIYKILKILEKSMDLEEFLERPAKNGASFNRDKMINIKVDILPDLTSNNLRDILTQKSVLAHEYYGHYLNHPSKFRIGDWRDEFRASYCAAIDAIGLNAEERRLLMLDAYDRAKEAGVVVKYNKRARRIIYGYDE